MGFSSIVGIIMKYLIDKPSYGRRVQVYKNLHKGCYSVRDAKTKRVIYHTNKIYLQEVVFKVSESGRQRVLKEKRKNVHAMVEGVWLPFLPVTMSTKYSIVYNPYKGNKFHCLTIGQDVESLPKVILNKGGIWA